MKLAAPHNRSLCSKCGTARFGPRVVAGNTAAGRPSTHRRRARPHGPPSPPKLTPGRSGLQLVGESTEVPHQLGEQVFGIDDDHWVTFRKYFLTPSLPFSLSRKRQQLLCSPGEPDATRDATHLLGCLPRDVQPHDCAIMNHLPLLLQVVKSEVPLLQPLQPPITSDRLPRLSLQTPCHESETNVPR